MIPDDTLLGFGGGANGTDAPDATIEYDEDGDNKIKVSGADWEYGNTVALTLKDATQSTTKDTGALVVEGGVGIEKKLFVGDDITAFDTSDIKLKDNITPIPNALDKVISISGNTFKWNSESDYEGKEDTGVIAQEIEKLGLPGMITTRPNGTKAVRYERLVPLLIEAIKELDTKVKSLGG